MENVVRSWKKEIIGSRKRTDRAPRDCVHFGKWLQVTFAKKTVNLALILTHKFTSHSRRGAGGGGARERNEL